jgi:hypothetical protein
VDNAIAGVGGAITIAGGAAGTAGGSPGGAGNAGGAVTLEGGAATGNSNGGAVTIRGGVLAGTGAHGIVTLGATNTSAVNIGASGITTTITGGLSQVTGAVSLSATAASSFTTSAGALTITSGATATWSTSAGSLKVQSATFMDLNAAAGGVNLQTSGTNRLAVADATVTVQAGVTLTTNSTGNINLPNNVNARFQVEGVSVGSTVTAANLNTLTNGSNADALHTHAASQASDILVALTAGEALAAGELVSIDNVAGAAKVFKADADQFAANLERTNSIGFAHAAAAGDGSAVNVLTGGEIDVPDAEWDSVPATTDVGRKAFMSTTAGNLSLTAPSASGDVVQKVGIVSRGGTGAVRVIVQIGDGVIL